VPYPGTIAQAPDHAPEAGSTVSTRRSTAVPLPQDANRPVKADVMIVA
jgi:hypothetical protein